MHLLSRGGNARYSATGIASGRYRKILLQRPLRTHSHADRPPFHPLGPAARAARPGVEQQAEHRPPVRPQAGRARPAWALNCLARKESLA